LYLCSVILDLILGNREIFLRELISNANDALEKLRITALTEKSVWDGTDPLNITIKVVKNEDGTNGRLVITGTFVSGSLHSSYLRTTRQRHWHVATGTISKLGEPWARMIDRMYSLCIGHIGQVGHI
jgi:hypothetical protein